MTMPDRLRAARQAASFSSARAAAEALNMRAATYTHHENGTKGFARHAARYAAFFRVSLEWLLTGKGEMRRAAGNAVRKTVKTYGFIGAGARVEMLNSATVEDLPQTIDLPAADEVAALIVRGNSMAPRFRNGEIILYELQPVDPADLIGHYAVVQTQDENDRQIKIVRRAPGQNAWRLESHNDDPQENVPLLAAWRMVGLLMPAKPAEIPPAAKNQRSRRN